MTASVDSVRIGVGRLVDGWAVIVEVAGDEGEKEILIGSARFETEAEATVLEGEFRDEFVARMQAEGYLAVVEDLR